MDMTLVKELIQPSLGIIIIFLICVGMFLKKMPDIADWIIPFVLWGTGIVMTILWFGVIDGNGVTLAVFVNGLVQGTLVAAVAVFGNQLYKQITNKEGDQ